jgi:hypothetical protein
MKIDIISKKKQKKQTKNFKCILDLEDEVYGPENGFNNYLATL